MRKILSMILIAALLLCMLSGCFLLEPFRQHEMLSGLPETQYSDNLPSEDETRPTQPEEDEPENILDYTLDQDMIDRFYDLLEESENTAIAGKDLKAAEDAADRLDEAYMELISQRQIAYVLYCMDQTSEIATERYLECVDLISEMELDYNAMCKRVYLSGTALRDALFADWTQKDIDMLLAYNEEIAKLEKRNAEIVLEYRDLEEYEWEENMVVLYNEMVKNNNRIAQIYGYENYYSYAYDVIYLRDYGIDSIALMRRYTSDYLSTIIPAAIARFDSVYSALESEQKQELSDLTYSSYSELQVNYVQWFIQDMPESSQKMMNDMFERERMVFTRSADAFKGAFTTVIDDEPFCFFGPEYMTTESVIHELGHYYGISNTDYWSQPMDLSETQSQGNEWMFFYKLRYCIDPEMYQALIEHRLFTSVSYLLGFVMIDQFEEQVYCHPDAGNLTLEEYDAIMEQVAQAYGGIDMISENVMDIQNYWKIVVLESPVYYISYGVSSIASLNLFVIAEEDEEQAEEIYRKLMEEPLEEEGFLANITAAGLEGPFDESVYAYIYNRYTN